MSESPTVHRRKLGAALRRLRETSGMRVADAAAAIKTSTTRLSRIETGKGKYKANSSDVERLCELYGVKDKKDVRRLLDMLTLSQRPGWWENEELPDGLDLYVGLENDADAERAWEPLLVHGLLQIEDYARAVLDVYPDNRPHDVDSLAEIRTRRQKLLTTDREPPLELWAILDEAVIRRPVGGAEVMRAQLHYLVQVASWANVTIQVLPNARGEHPGLGGAFSLLDFEDPADTVVYCDSPPGNLYLERRSDVRRFSKYFDLLRAQALAPADSMALMRRTAEEMK